MSPEVSPTVVEVDGRTLRLTNLDKILYPATETTKGEVLHYYASVAPRILAQTKDQEANFEAIIAQKKSQEASFEEALDNLFSEIVARTARLTIALEEDEDGDDEDGDEDRREVVFTLTLPRFSSEVRCDFSEVSHLLAKKRAPRG